MGLLNAIDESLEEISSMVFKVKCVRAFIRIFQFSISEDKARLGCTFLRTVATP
jgi:hypothetical protein